MGFIQKTSRLTSL